jgi:TPR repeat protein
MARRVVGAFTALTVIGFVAYLGAAGWVLGLLTDQAGYTDERSSGSDTIELIEARNQYGLDQCNAETRAHFENAARSDQPIPTGWLAHMLNTGRCSFDADPARARTLAMQALPTLTTLAVTGDADANFLLGSAYEEGLGVTANHIMARNHYRRSCESDFPIACGYLGRMYYNDADSDETTEQMLQYWNKSCDGGWFKSCDSVSGLYATGDRVKKDMRKAIQISQKTCSGGFASGCARLGAVYYQGDSVKRDLNQARKYFNSACEAHDAEGCVLLAWMYHSGEGVAKDSRKATSVVQGACSRGSQKACEMVKKIESDTQSEAKQAKRSSTQSQRTQGEADLREAALREALRRAYGVDENVGATHSNRAQQPPSSLEGRVSARMQGRPTVLGAMNVDEVNRRLAGQVANLAGCYQENLLAGRTVQGALSVKLDIKRNGTVKKVTISSSPSSGGTGNRCATRKLKRTPFPHADDGRPTIVTASFQFSSD